MRLISTYNLKKGMIVAKAVYDSNGRLLINEGMIITEKYIQRLKELGLTSIYIQDEISQDVVINDVITVETRQDAKEIVKDSIKRVNADKQLDIQSVHKVVENIIDELLDRQDMIFDLQDIRAKDEYTFGHCVNVCVLSLMMGIVLEYDRGKLINLGTGTLLHDLGKIKIPDSILKKPGKLTKEEFDEIKRHTIYGYQMLKENKEISGYSCYIALCHHERPDGRGYPFGLTGDKIHEFAKITAICDVYDALTSNRVYRQKLKIPDAIEYIRLMSTSQFDNNLVKKFLRLIPLYPVGTGVILNNGKKAMVVKYNRDMPDRPVVRVIPDYDNGYYEQIDLMNELTLFIIDSYDM